MKNIKLRIYLKLISIEVVIILTMRFLVPILSNYPPYSEDVGFQMKIESLSHNQQYLLLGIIAILLQVLFIHLFFSDIFKYLKKDKKDVSTAETEKIRKICFKIPNKLLLVQTLLLCLMLTLLFSMVKISIVLCLKFLLIYFSFFTASWVISMALIQGDLNKIIESTYRINQNITMPQNETKFYISLIKNLMPLFIFIMITVSLLGYSKVAEQDGESRYYFYKQEMSSLDLNNLSISELKEKLDTVSLRDASNYYFILTDDSTYYSKPNGNVTQFFLEYAKNFIGKTDGRLYEYFGVEEEAYGKYVTLSNGKVALVGFKYSTMNLSSVSFYALTSIVCTAIYIIILFIFTKNISKNISQVSDKLSQIAAGKDVEREYVLPVFSNDEIGALTVSFNQIQQLTKSDIAKIRNSQNMLMERERLATLGQMVGGIAHNLKTPIMSIAGAMDGMQDLVTEYNKSIDDPDVTKEDHHAIAHDMCDWISKVNSYDSYMSDIITAVKGQAVNMNDNSSNGFSIDELLKRVDILMKHELKSACITLNVNCNITPSTFIDGNVNNLVQVVNNLISNAIQSYNDVPNNKIDLTISSKDNNILISVSDYGSGIPIAVQKRLFNSMITTKGHNGTGLGLFMSYSTIKGNFEGDMNFTSEVGKGTTFNVILPQKKENN